MAEQGHQALRRLFWQVIVNNENGLRKETTFDFKYIPDLSKKTHMEDVLEPGSKNVGIERRNLQALGIGCGLLTLVGLLGLNIMASVIHGCLDSREARLPVATGLGIWKVPN